MKRLLFGLLICALPATQAFAQSQNTPVQPPLKEPPSLTGAQKYFSDVELVNQHGQQLRFYSDLLQGKVVIISSFMATCKGACPPKNLNLEKIQNAAGDRLGKDVLILSITVDPVTDTPAKLKEYASAYHAKPGWHFLSGKKENVDWALYKIGQYVAKKEDHVNIVVMGNEKTGLWKKTFGLAAAAELIKVFEEVANDKVVPK
jgi:protein SCO1/2